MNFIDWKVFRFTLAICMLVVFILGTLAGIVLVSIYDWLYLFIVVPVGGVFIALSVGFFFKQMDNL